MLLDQDVSVVMVSVGSLDIGPSGKPRSSLKATFTLTCLPASSSVRV